MQFSQTYGDISAIYHNFPFDPYNLIVVQILKLVPVAKYPALSSIS